MEKITEFFMLNWMMVLAALILVGLIARSYVMPARVKSLRPIDAVRLMNQSDALVVDVRANDEYQKGHIVNSLHMPLANLESRLVDIVAYKSSPIILVCRSGNRSYQAGLTMKKKGFEQVYNMRGGMQDWQQGNLPITTKVSKIKPPKAVTKTNVDEPKTEEPIAEESIKAKPDSVAESDTTANDGASVVELSSQLESVDTTEPEKKTVNEARNVVIYTSRLCPYCARAVNLLTKKGVEYQEVSIDGQPEKRAEMERRAQRTTVPQIFVDDDHIGDCDEIYALESQGELDVLFGLAEPQLEAELA